MYACQSGGKSDVDYGQIPGIIRTDQSGDHGDGGKSYAGSYGGESEQADNPKMRVVLKNTVAMLKDMEMEIVVEGIETQEMLDFFTELQCDFIQGYFFSKPLPKPEFINFLKSQTE